MWSVSRPAASRSVEEIAVLFDMRREAQRMLAHEALGELCVAALERLDDVHVLDDRPRRPGEQD